MSILNTTKKLLGIPVGVNEFDTDLIADINTVLAGLYQMGIGPEKGFAITGNRETWTDFAGMYNSLPIESLVTTYTFHKVRLSFDPPTSQAHIDCLKQLIEEEEFRLRSFVDWGGMK